MSLLNRERVTTENHFRTSVRSSPTMPSSSQMTMTGSGSAKAFIRSTGSSVGHRSSSPFASSSMCGRRSRTWRGVKAVLAMWRNRVCRGGSEKRRLSSSVSHASPNSAW